MPGAPLRVPGVPWGDSGGFLGGPGDHFVSILVDFGLQNGSKMVPGAPLGVPGVPWGSSGGFLGGPGGLFGSILVDFGLQNGIQNCSKNSKNVFGNAHTFWDYFLGVLGTLRPSKIWFFI